MPTISDQDMRAAVAKAVLETLDQNKRDILIQQALETLISPRKGEGWNAKDRPSMLDEVFTSELQHYAREVVRGYFTNDGPMRKKFDDFIHKMVERMLTDENGELGHAFAEAISDGLKKSLSRY